MEDIEQKDVDLKENNEEGEELESENDSKEEAKADPTPQPKREFTTEEKLARVTRLKQRYEKELGIEPHSTVVVERKQEPQPKARAGELDETQLEILELRGISAKEDIDVIQAVMERTGQNLRAALKDEYVQSKLKANKDKRDIENAMPGAPGRASAPQTSVEQALAEYERSGKLPNSFDLRLKVIEAKERKEGDERIPPWKR